MPAIVVMRKAFAKSIKNAPTKETTSHARGDVDVDYADKDLVRFAQKELEAIGIQYKVLGTYPIYLISDHGKERRWVKKIP